MPPLASRCSSRSRLSGNGGAKPPRTGRDQQDDHRQPVHDRRRRLPVHGRADPAVGRQDRPVLAAAVRSVNSIGFAHILPVSLALFTKIARKQITATVIGLYYLAFFAANKMVGYVGGLYSSLPTTTFWLIHIASAGVGLVAFIVFKIVLGKRMATGLREQAEALS